MQILIETHFFSSCLAVGSSSSSVPKSASPLTTTASPSTNIITTSASARQQQQLAAFAAAHNTKSNAAAGQAKIFGQTPAGLVVTQLAPGNIALRAGTLDVFGIIMMHLSNRFLSIQHCLLMPLQTLDSSSDTFINVLLKIIALSCRKSCTQRK